MYSSPTAPLAPSIDKSNPNGITSTVNPPLLEENVPSSPPVPRASILQVSKAVFWAFLGIRKRQDYAQDAAQITPLQVIIVGILGAALFVGILLLVVRWVIASHTS